MVEQATVNRWVAGSNPAGGAILTTDQMTEITPTLSVLELYNFYSDEIKEFKNTLRKSDICYIYTLYLQGEAQAYPGGIGVDGSTFSALKDNSGNTMHRFYARVIVDKNCSTSEVKKQGRIKFIALAGSFAYINGIGFAPHIDQLASRVGRHEEIETFEEFLRSTEEADSKGNALGFLTRNLKKDKDTHYKLVEDTYLSIESGDVYTLQGVKYLCSGMSLVQSPSESIVSYFKILEVLNRKLLSLPQISDKPDQFTGSRLDQIIKDCGMNIEIKPALEKFRDVRNQLLGHGIIEPEIQNLLGTYIPVKNWEKELINTYGDIETGLTEYSLSAETLGRKLFSVIANIPFFILQYPSCAGQLTDPILIGTNALNPIGQTKYSWEGVVCSGVYLSELEENK